MNNSGNTQPNNEATSPDRNPGAARRKRWMAIGATVAVLAVAAAVWASAQTATSPVSAKPAGPPSTSSAEQTRVGTPSPSETATASPSATAAPPSATAAPAGTQPPSTAASQPPAPATDPAPVDRQGKSDEQLATIEQPVAAPVPFVAKKEIKSGVSATITELQAVQGEATGIGEVAGPALRFRVTVNNGTGSDVPLESALVNVSFGKDNQPASALSGPDTSSFPDTLQAGTSASAVFVFGVPKDARDHVRIYFNLDAATPIATFEGQAPA